METNTGSTRDRILTLLRRADCTVDRLAAELGVTDNAIRPHLEALDTAGLVTRADVLRKGVGKPANVYALTAAGDESFAKAYAPVLGALGGSTPDPAILLRFVERSSGFVQRLAAASDGNSREVARWTSCIITFPCFGCRCAATRSSVASRDTSSSVFIPCSSPGRS